MQNTGLDITSVNEPNAQTDAQAMAKALNAQYPGGNYQVFYDASTKNYQIMPASAVPTYGAAGAQPIISTGGGNSA